MASCHSLTYINGVLSGDPLDKILFDATGWSLEEPEVDESAQFDMLFPTVVKPNALTREKISEPSYSKPTKIQLASNSTSNDVSFVKLLQTLYFPRFCNISFH